MLAPSFEIARKFILRWQRAAIEAAACLISDLTNVNARASEWQAIALSFTKEGALEVPFLYSLGLESRYQRHVTVEESFLKKLYSDLRFKPRRHHVFTETSERKFGNG
jgi:hypothetical protein